MLSDQLADAQAVAVTDLLRQDSSPIALLGVADNAAGFAETMTTKVRHPDSPPVACGRGCSWCCHQTIPVSAPEVFRVLRFLDALEHQDRSATVARLRKLDRETHGATSSTRAKLQLPCAFLHDGSCTVYPARPLVCAEFTSYDVEDCKRGYRFGFGPQSVVHEKARMVVYNAVHRGLFEGLKRALPGSDNAVLELTAAVIAALDTDDAANLWRAGGDVFSKSHLSADSSNDA